jgi:hypothetical protein
MLDVRLLSRLRRVFRIGRDVFAVMFLFLLHFLIMRDIAGIGHGDSSIVNGTWPRENAAPRKAAQIPGQPSDVNDVQAFRYAAQSMWVSGSGMGGTPTGVPEALTGVGSVTAQSSSITPNFPIAGSPDSELSARASNVRRSTYR